MCGVSTQVVSLDRWSLKQIVLYGCMDIHNNTYHRVTAIGIFVMAVTFILAVRTPGLAGTGLVTGRPEKPGRTHTVTKHAVTVPAGTQLRALHVTVVAIVTRGTAILTVVSPDPGWTVTGTGLGVT